MKPSEWALDNAWRVVAKFTGGATVADVRRAASAEEVRAVECIAEALDGAYAAGAQDASK